MNASPQFADHVRHYEKHTELDMGVSDNTHPDGPLPPTNVHKFGAYTKKGQGAYVLYRHSPSSHTVFKPNDSYVPGPDGQIPMMGARKRGEHTLAMAFATKGHEYLVSGLLGRAALHSLRTYGRVPEADSDLSPDSARMVQRLVDKGLIRAPNQSQYQDDVADQPEDRVRATNSFSKGDTEARFVRDSSYQPGTEARPEDVHEGEYAMRHALREQRDSPKYEQLQMFATRQRSRNEVNKPKRVKGANRA
jgi:hypothetical protein